MGTSLISPGIVEDLCKRYSHEKIEKDFEILSYSLKKNVDAPSGFLGRHEVLYVKIRQTSKNNNTQEVVFFIKSAPSDIFARAQYIEEFGVFKKEIKVYRDLIPRLQRGFHDFAPQCYYAKGDILVFEHLAEMGYRMGADRSGILDFNHLKCALKSVACMHASSIIFEERSQRKISDMFPEIVRENSYPSDKNNIRLVNFNNAIVSICELIKIMPEYKNSNRLDYILQQIPLKMKKIFELCKPSLKYRNVFSHGDLWANNLLFKYENGIPIESRIVDFQLTRYSPPIVDVITLLTIPTTKEFRMRNLAALLNIYFAFLSNYLTENGLEVKKDILKKQFEKSVNEYKIVGLIESCLFSHLTVLPTKSTQSLTSDTEGFEDFFDRKRSEICLNAFKTDKIYRNRLTDMISDLINNYILI